MSKARVQDELNELNMKIESYTTFLNTLSFHQLNQAQQESLPKQLMHMKEYAKILQYRINNWA